MSRTKCHILKQIGRPKKLLVQFLLTIAAVLIMPGRHASAQADSWRRTANGWEQTEAWDHLVAAPVGKLRALTIGTLIQRTWPATFAAAELSLVLAILQIGRASVPSHRD